MGEAVVVDCVAALVSVPHQRHVVNLQAAHLRDPHEVAYVHFARALFVDDKEQVECLLDIGTVGWPYFAASCDHHASRLHWLQCLESYSCVLVVRCSHGI